MFQNSSRDSRRSNKGNGKTNKGFSGEPPLRPLSYLEAQLLEAQILTAGGFNEFVTGITEEDKLNSLRRSLAQPTLVFQAMIQVFCACKNIAIEREEVRQYTKEKIPLIIDHELETPTDDWVQNLKRTLRNIFEKNKKKNLFQNFLDEIDLIRKNENENKMIVAMITTLLDMNLKVVIHDGLIFPSLEPEILGTGTFSYHFLRQDSKLIAVTLRSHQAKQRLLLFMDMTPEERAKCEVVSVNWSNHIEYMFAKDNKQAQHLTQVTMKVQVQQQETLEIDLKPPVKQDYVLEGYHNIAMPLSSGLIELAKLKEQNCNLIFPIGYETNDYGLWGSLFYKNGILYGLFIDNGDKKKKRRTYAWSEFKKDSRLETSLEICPNCEKYLGTTRQIFNHQRLCQKEIKQGQIKEEQQELK